ALLPDDEADNERNQQAMRIVFVVPPVRAEVLERDEIHKRQRCSDGYGFIQISRDGDTHAVHQCFVIRGAISANDAMVRAGKYGPRDERNKRSLRPKYPGPPQTGKYEFRLSSGEW